MNDNLAQPDEEIAHIEGIYKAIDGLPYKSIVRCFGAILTDLSFEHKDLTPDNIRDVLEEMKSDATEFRKKNLN